MDDTGPGDDASGQSSSTAPLISTGQLLPTSRQDLICLVLLFVLSWYVRSLYQSESTTDNPLRGDAGKYAWSAYNLHFHGAFSKELPTDEPPQSRTDLAPGYPLFLTLFVSAIDEPPGWDLALDGIRHWQAIMGAVTVMLCYALARQSLSLAWALLVGLLCCFCPHLIALSDFVLTESLFLLLLMAGFLLLAIGWRRPHLATLFSGFFLVALSAEVRYLALAMPLWLLPVYFRPAKKQKPAVDGEAKLPSAGKIVRSTLRLAIASMIAAVVCVQILHVVFVHQTVKNMPEAAEPPHEHFRLGYRLQNLARTFQPPNFYVRGESHVGVRNGQQDWRDRTELSFAQAPAAYLRWNLYGRTLFSWHFDNSYHGDVYIYPMTRSGFEEHPLLRAVHRTMYALHWPLYGLALGGLMLVAYQTWQGTLTAAGRGLWLPALGLSYFVAALYFLAWLPRYSIPARPFSYILAAGLLCICAQRWTKEQNS